MATKTPTVGLSSKQVNQLSSMKRIDKGLLAGYKPTITSTPTKSSSALTNLSVANTPPSKGGGGTTTTPPVDTASNYTTSPELKAMSIANAPAPVKRNVRGGLDKPINPLQTSQTARAITGSYTPPKTAANFEQELGRSAQQEITSLNKYAKEQIESLKPRQEERLAETSSVNTLTGLAGSTEANRMTEKTGKINQQEDDLVRAKLATDVNQILSNVRSQAQSLAQDERTNSRLDSAEARAAKAASTAEAVQNVAVLSQAGVNADAFKTQDPEAYNAMASQVGGEEMLKAMFTLNRPVEQVLDKRIEGGKYVIAYQNPIDGKVRIESVDLGLPVGYSKTIDAGNRILAIPDNWGGDPADLITINKGLTPTQAASTSNSSVAGGAVSGVVSRDADSIMSGALNLTDVSTAKNYRSEVAAELNRRIKAATETGDMYGTMKASASYDKEPSDTFLQSMEKTIAVMEQLGVLQQNIAGTDTGPLVGAFRSANPWDDNAQTIKAQLSAIVPNLARGVYGEVGVLTDNDIKNYAKTIPTLTSTEDVRNAVLYITIDSIKRNIETKIKNQAAGQRDMSGYADIYKQVQDTANQILNTLPKSSQPGSGSVLRSPDGTQEVKISDLTPEQIKEAKTAGWQ